MNYDKRIFELQEKINKLNNQYQESQESNIDEVPQYNNLIGTGKANITNRKLNFIDRLKDKFKPSKTILVEMFNNNGTIDHKVVTLSGNYWIEKNNTYIIDEDCAIFNNSLKLYMYRYHESFSLPFKVSINSNELKDSSNKNNYEISTSFNPSVLYHVIKAEYAKGVVSGAEVSQFLKRTFLLVIINLGVLLIFMLLQAYKSGWI